MNGREAHYLTPEQIETATSMWQQNEPVDSVCRALGITRDTMIQRRTDQLAHLPRRSVGSGRKSRHADPTPEEIESRCAEIRARWSDEEWRERIVGPVKLQVFQWPE